MKLSETQTGDVFRTPDGREFVRTGMGIWHKHNIMSLPNYVPGTMAPGIEVEIIGKMSVERRALNDDRGAHGTARCHYCRKMVPVDTEDQADRLVQRLEPCIKCQAEKRKDDGAAQSWMRDVAQLNRERIQDTRSQ